MWLRDEGDPCQWTRSSPRRGGIYLVDGCVITPKVKLVEFGNHPKVQAARGFDVRCMYPDN